MHSLGGTRQCSSHSFSVCIFCCQLCFPQSPERWDVFKCWRCYELWRICIRTIRLRPHSVLVVIIGVKRQGLGRKLLLLQLPLGCWLSQQLMQGADQLVTCGHCCMRGPQLHRHRSQQQALRVCARAMYSRVVEQRPCVKHAPTHAQAAGSHPLPLFLQLHTTSLCSQMMTPQRAVKRNAQVPRPQQCRLEWGLTRHSPHLLLQCSHERSTLRQVGHTACSRTLQLTRQLPQLSLSRL